jgi:hypothetical protein
MFDAITKNNFLSKENCEYLISTANASNLWESGGGDFWNNRVINFHRILGYDSKAADILLDANIRCGNIIKNNYHIKEIYSDTLQIVRWFPEMEQPPHADDMTNTDIDGFQHRAFGSIIYLNNDYTGGHTYYPVFNTEIVPEIGKLAIHPGDPDHLHGVTKIKDKLRYTIASFWTLDKGKSIDWSIH